MSNLPLIHSYRPRSFRERGLAVPFTTPMLIGARLRQPMVGMAQDGQRQTGPGLEVIVPNPSGGRGVYILPWGNIGALGRPTMHDVVLGRVLNGILGAQGGELSPRLVAEAVVQTAAQGLAGREAADVSAQQLRDAEAAVAATREALVLLTTAHVEGPDPIAGKLSDDTREGVEHRGLAALAVLAAEFGKPVASLVEALDQLALCFADIGVGPHAATAPLPRLVMALAVLQSDVTSWAQAEGGQTGDFALAEMRDALAIAATSDLTARMAGRLLDRARASLADPREALRSFVHDPTRVQSLCSRPAWLLSGWEMICRLWNAAPGLMSHHQAVQDMARCLPSLPDEVESWLGLAPGSVEQVGRLPTMVLTRRDPSAHVDRVARLEHLRAVAV